MEKSKPLDLDEVMRPSDFVYRSRNELRDAYNRKIGHTANIVRSSMIIAYTQAIDDVTRLLHAAEKRAKEQLENGATDANT